MRNFKTYASGYQFRWTTDNAQLQSDEATGWPGCPLPAMAIRWPWHLRSTSLNLGAAPSSQTR
jgi:hypothetical protein